MEVTVSRGGGGDCKGGDFARGGGGGEQLANHLHLQSQMGKNNSLCDFFLQISVLHEHTVKQAEKYCIFAEFHLCKRYLSRAVLFPSDSSQNFGK